MAIETTNVLIRFEDPAGSAQFDDVGGLAPLQAPAGTALPGSEIGVVGTGAVFGSGKALQAIDLANGATALPRDITIQALVRWDIAAQNTLGTPGTIIARGIGTSAAEYMPFALELYVLDPVARTGLVRWLWQTTGGVLKVQIGGGFIAPTGYVMLTATRRWTSPTSTTLRYYIGDRLLAEVATVDGDIASSASGSTTIGARSVAGTYTNFLAGAIDELRISNYEMSAEEISSVWYRIAIAGPDGKRQIADLLPPGLPISSDPASRAQQDLASMGAALAFVDGQIENFRQNIMPDRAYGDLLRRWEGITQQPAGLGDSLDVRRTRVLAHLGSRLGVSIPGVDQSLAAVLACQPSDLAVYGFDSTTRDAFATLDPQRWFVPNTGVDVTGGELRLQIANAAYARWDDVATGWGGVIAAALPLNSRPNRSLSRSRSFSASMFASMDIRTLPIGCEAGIFIASWSNASKIFLGAVNIGGAISVGYQRFKFGVRRDAPFPVPIAGVPGANPLNLRIIPFNGSLTIGQDEIGVSVASTTVANPTESDWLANQVNVAVAADMDWMGFYLRTFDTAAAYVAGDVRFLSTSALRDNFSDRPFYWYAYRNPALPGAPDFAGANRIVNRMRHGYTAAAAISSLQLLCDDPASGCDLGPTAATL